MPSLPLRLLRLVVSCVVLGVGVALLLDARLGSDGYSMFVSGLSIATGVSFGLVNAGVGVVLVLLAWARGRRPGIGTVVAEPPEARAGDRQRLLKDEVEKLVVEAKRVGVDLDEVVDAIKAGWKGMRGGK